VRVLRNGGAPGRTSAIGWLGVTHFALGNLADAQRLLREAVARSPKRAMFHYWLAATAGQIGDADKMCRQAKALLGLGRSRHIGCFRTEAMELKNSVNGLVRRRRHTQFTTDLDDISS
jgi:hypothetical protein